MEKKGSFFNLEETLRRAMECFTALDPAVVATRAGAGYDSDEKSITLKFINQDFRVQHPAGEVTETNGKPASIYTAIIILHYLVTADGRALTGRWIAYRHLPGGDIYIDPFQKRAVLPFLKSFGHRPDEFVKAAEKIGGNRLDLSGTSMTIPVLPRVPVCFTIWPGDDEIAASANILFDEAAPGYLPTEDYAHLPAIVTGAMKALS